MAVSSSSYYAWRRSPSKIISAETLHLHRRCKALHADSRESLGSRGLSKALREEGFKVGRDKAKRLMKTLNLVSKQRQAYKVTTDSGHNHGYANNLVDQQFNPKQPNQIWAGDITYCRTQEGWLYLAVVIDLYSRKVIGWAADK